MNDFPFVSVIVPTYRCWDDTFKCLSALENQTYQKDRFEIIIVNNDPNDAPYLSLGEAILVEEAAVGSYAARNKGLSVARGNIIAFTDSDCVPHADWLSEAVNLIKLTNTPRIAGRVVFSFGHKKLSAVEAYQKALSFNQEKNAAKGRSVTANMVCQRAVFERVGSFDEKLFSGGDWEWSRRASEAGFGIAFGSCVVVYHPARTSWHELLKKSRRINSAGNHRSSILFSILEFTVSVIKIFVPPMKRAKDIFKNPDLSFLEKAKAWLVCYVLKIHGHGIKALNQIGIIRPSRS